MSGEVLGLASSALITAQTSISTSEYFKKTLAIPVLAELELQTCPSIFFSTFLEKKVFEKKLLNFEFVKKYIDSFSRYWILKKNEKSMNICRKNYQKKLTRPFFCRNLIPSSFAEKKSLGVTLKFDLKIKTL